MGDHGMPSMTQVGRLEMGTAANPIAVGRTADIVIANSPLGSGVADPDQFGPGIINFGKFTMHGAGDAAPRSCGSRSSARRAHHRDAVRTGVWMATGRSARDTRHAATMKESGDHQAAAG